MQGKAAGAARVGGRAPALKLHQAIVNIRSMLTQAFQCFVKEADGARSPFLPIAHQRLRAQLQLQGPQQCSGRKMVKSSA